MKTPFFQLLSLLILPLFSHASIEFYEENLKATDKYFVVVICSYNNEDWYERNLDSVFDQTYPNFHVIYIDDASKDRTALCVEEYIKKHHLEKRITLIKNPKNEGAMSNHYKGFQMCKSHHIIVDLDGDDWLAHRNVLADLNRAYSEEDIWLTYGQFIYYPSYQPGIGREATADVIANASFRHNSVGTTQQRSFYAGLFKMIKKEDLLFEGKFIGSAYDLAYMLPMLEMAGKHIKYIPEVSYVYNIGTSLNDFKIRFNLQNEMDHYIRAKERYAPITHWTNREKTKKIYITPGYWGELFSINNPAFNRDGCLDVLYQLRQEALDEGFELSQADQIDSLEEFDYLVVFDVFPDQIHKLKRYPKEKLILFLWEPPSVIPDNYNPLYHDHFSKVYTWDDNLVDNKKYFKFHYPVKRPMVKPVDFYNKRLATLIACNKNSSHPDELYHERDKVIQFYEKEHLEDFDLYGKWWPRAYKSYQGPIDRKVDYLKYYRFCYTYENIKDIPGYITEKIFDCFQAGVVPIYWGASNITDYVPANCFIARDTFNSDEELYAFIKKMNEHEYDHYLTNIKSFLETPAADLYSKQHFINTFIKLIKAP